MFTIEALQVLTFLLPGFLAALVLSALAPRRKTTDLGRVIEAMAFTFATLTLFSVASLEMPIGIIQVDDVITYQYSSNSMLALAGISVGLGVIVGIVITYDLHMRVARILGFSKKTSRPSVWVDVFYSYDKYVIVNFADERRLLGWPRHFSLDPADPFVFLTDAAWEVEGKGFREIDAEGILITPNLEIESIEVLNDADQV